MGNAGLIAATRADLGKVTGREYVEQFAKAVRAGVGVSIDQAALAKLKGELAGTAGSASDSN